MLSTIIENYISEVMVSVHYRYSNCESVEKGIATVLKGVAGLGSCLSISLMASVSSITSTNDDNQVGSLSFDLRVAAIFVLMLFGSAGTFVCWPLLLNNCIGVSTPLLTTRFTRFRSNSFLFMIGKAFGAGVVISTAYIHILPSAQDLLEEVLSVRAFFFFFCNSF